MIPFMGKKALQAILAVCMACVLAWPTAAFAAGGKSASSSASAAATQSNSSGEAAKTKEADSAAVSVSTAVAEQAQDADKDKDDKEEEVEPYVILEGESKIEKLEAAYKKAVAAFEEANAKVEEIQQRIDEVEAEIPTQQARSDIGMKQRYIMQSNPLMIVDVIVGSQSLGDVLRYGEYLEHITKSGLQELARLNALKAELQEARDEQDRLNAEVNKQYELTDKLLSEEHAERVKKQEEGIAEAIEEAVGAAGSNSDEDSDEREGAKEGSSSASSSNSSSSSSSSSSNDDEGTSIGEGQEVLIDVTPDSETEALSDGVDWTVTQEEFMEEWTKRIDDYLEGSALEGQGANFAAAAWKHCIDPRWSPAISCIESGKGEICIRPHNAWGWGAADVDPYGLALEWSSWEQAIDAHVKGLADGYGYTISMSKAYKYCPVNWKYWYNWTLDEMSQI